MALLHFEFLVENWLSMMGVIICKLFGKNKSVQSCCLKKGYQEIAEPTESPPA
jgi:hypothetical protein